MSNAVTHTPRAARTRGCYLRAIGEDARGRLLPRSRLPGVQGQRGPAPAQTGGKGKQSIEGPRMLVETNLPISLHSQ